MNETVTELQSMWDSIKNELQNEVDDQRFFDVFLSDSFIYSISNDLITIIANSNFAVSVLSQKYETIIKNAIKKVLNLDLKIKFDVKDNVKSNPQTEERPEFFRNSINHSSLTFDNFVTGPANIEAKQAALYIASNPGITFNPLFIYSNPGLGKTHLLHAIMNFIHEKTPGKRVLYCESADFFQEYVNFTTGAKQQDSLKKYFDDIDVFLIDDIQGLATKEKTQLFFFDIFQNLYNHNKQIVITSDKHPQELKNFEERLKSRFASGLTISINQPDFETCVSIVKSKITNSPLDINSFDPEVINLIASKFNRNIRDIDGAFSKLIWYVTNFKPTNFVDLNTAKEALQSLIDVKDSKSKLNEQKILTVVADYYNLSVNQLTGQSREGKIALARHIAMYLIKKMLDVPYTRIGLMFGGKDHSTVMSGVEKVENSIKTNTALEQAIGEIKSQLKS